MAATVSNSDRQFVKGTDYETSICTYWAYVINADVNACVSMAYFLQIMHCVWCLLTYIYVVLYIPNSPPQNVCRHSEQRQTFWGGELGTQQADILATLC